MKYARDEAQMKKLSEGGHDQMKLDSDSLLRKEHLKILNEWQNHQDQDQQTGRHLNKIQLGQA